MPPKLLGGGSPLEPAPHGGRAGFPLGQTPPRPYPREVQPKRHVVSRQMQHYRAARGAEGYPA